MDAHDCRPGRTCTCRIDGLEPNESCPIHGAGEWPPRCEVCGKFLPWPRPTEDADDRHARVS